MWRRKLDKRTAQETAKRAKAPGGANSRTTRRDEQEKIVQRAEFGLRGLCASFAGAYKLQKGFCIHGGGLCAPKTERGPGVERKKRVRDRRWGEAGILVDAAGSSFYVEDRVPANKSSVKAGRGGMAQSGLGTPSLETK